MRTKKQPFQVKAFTLMELLITCSIILLLSLLASTCYSRIKSLSLQGYCGNNLRQVNGALYVYRERYSAFPILARPSGLGDRTNWKDLFGHLDGGMGYFAEGSGDATRAPRIPRLLESYTDDIQSLFCPGQGAFANWKNVGPYYYNTNDPFADDTPLWRPMTMNPGMRMRHPLAGCQSPTMTAIDSTHTWRHGFPHGKGGINQHLFADGSVRRYDNPNTWDAQDLPRGK